MGNEILIGHDMKINKSKTKVMAISENSEINILFNNKIIEQVHKFQYVVVMIKENGNLENRILN